ncbi:MAG: hypothetical protein APF77_17775 [Clostridia bacterium BRH_c25]|nr:MAG: hypothetical protein APF77_17775 [Clostridia bacterium BRH_c25]
MADGITELAMLFKERENKSPISFVMGTVKSAVPMVIAPEGINFSLGTDDLIIPERLTEWDEEVRINGQVVIIHHEGLKPYERVALLPSADGQKYFVIDRVVV